ncbi:MAG: GIY-YIG nuclease family protein, partial [Balneolaceae bacterium]|nr:GIY-YIG nuclease family protein [Balneolaceae bacterium]
LKDRTERHNAGKSRATRSGVPWELKWSRGYPSRSQAVRVEKKIKNMKSREVIERIIAGEQMSILDETG